MFGFFVAIIIAIYLKFQEQYKDWDDGIEEMEIDTPLEADEVVLNGERVVLKGKDYEN